MQFPVTARSHPSSDSQAIRAFGTAIQAAPAAAVGLCAVLLAWREHGSFAAGSWLPYSIALCGVAAAVLLAGVAAPPARAATIALAGFVALALWDVVSAAWAPSASLARDEGLLVLTYALAFGVALVTLWSRGRALAAVASVAAASGGLAVAAAIALVWGDAQVAHYYGGRLAFPISYVNATGALFAVGFWPAVVIAARRASRPVVRSLALGSATASLGGVLMTQSKGAVLGLVAATLVVLAFAPGRLRLLPPLALAAALGSVAFDRLTEPFRVTGADPIRHAGAALLTLVTVAVLVGLPYALLDASVRVSRARARLAGRLVLGAAVLAAVAGAAAFVVHVQHPAAWVEAKWRAAHDYTSADQGGSSHLVQLGSNRFDFWRVALGEFERHPLVGDGARGFGPAYLLHGSSDETPRRAHSLPLDVLSETGVVGICLLAAALLLPTWIAIRRARRDELAAVAALGGFGAWFVQSWFDWIATIPAATLLAVVLLGAGAAARDGAGPVPRRAARAVAVAAAAIALVVLAPPWLASRFTQQGIAARSQADLDRAHWLDPLSTEPLLATVWTEPLPAAIPSLEAAARREPRMVATRYALGAAYLQSGRRADARRELEAALRLKPGDRLIRTLLAQAR